MERLKRQLSALQFSIIAVPDRPKTEIRVSVAGYVPQQQNYDTKGKRMTNIMGTESNPSLKLLAAFIQEGPANVKSRNKDRDGKPLKLRLQP